MEPSVMIKMILMIIAVLIYSSTIPGSGFATFAGIQADLSENSDPNFFKCGVTEPFKGIATLPGLNRSASLYETLFDSSRDTIVAGRTVVDITFPGEGLINLPGNDIILYESNSTEPINVSIYDDEKRSFTPPKQINVSFTGDKNSCSDNVNIGSVDLDIFGLQNQSSVKSVRIDNVGESDCCHGSDISGIEFPQISEEKRISHIRDSSFLCMVFGICPVSQ